MLTHHPENATPADGVTFLNCGPAEAVRIGLAAVGGKNLEVFSPTIGRQLLGLGLIDEIDLHISPILLGDGERLFDNLAGRLDQYECVELVSSNAATHARITRSPRYQRKKHSTASVNEVRLPVPIQDG